VVGIGRVAILAVHLAHGPVLRPGLAAAAVPGKVADRRRVPFMTVRAEGDDELMTVVEIATILKLEPSWFRAHVRQYSL
jgi:hypothetical protein